MAQGKLLIVWHSRTGSSEQIARAASEGAGIVGVLKPAADVRPVDLLEAGGYLFICPENLATMSGMMKEMFDRTYYAVLGRIEGRPYATVIAAGSDGEGAQRQIDRIATGWRLKRVSDPWIVAMNADNPEAIMASKSVDPSELRKARELGEALAEGISLGIF